MKSISNWPLFLCLLALGSCQSSGSKMDVEQGVATHAHGFSFHQTDSGYALTILNPWQGATNEYQTYHLVERSRNTNSNAAKGAIRIPIERAVCLSTTHVAFIASIGNANNIVGVSGASFVCNSEVQQRIYSGKIVDVGYEQSIDYELLVSLNPDVVFAYGVGAESMGYLKRIADLGIPVVVLGEYLENDPLGKAEWIKVFGLFFGKECEAQHVFQTIDSAYNALKSKVVYDGAKPKVFLNLPWNDVWYFPGNESYMVQLIRDAGGDYLLSHLTGSRSYPLSFESALERGANADIWINQGSYTSMGQIVADFPRLKNLGVVKNGALFNNNARMSSGGGNDFWELGAVAPHLILEDLIGIFHSHSTDKEFHFYKKLE